MKFTILALLILSVSCSQFKPARIPADDDAPAQTYKGKTNSGEECDMFVQPSGRYVTVKIYAFGNELVAALENFETGDTSFEVTSKAMTKKIYGENRHQRMKIKISGELKDLKPVKYKATYQDSGNLINPTNSSEECKF